MQPTINYGSPEYGRAWREKHKERLAADRKVKYHTIMKVRYLRRRYWLNRYKVSKGCYDCGYNAHGVALDFDHLNPADKRFNISHRLCNSALPLLFKEIRKCVIRCANCHRIKTLEENQFENISSPA